MTALVTLSALRRDADRFVQFKRAMGHPYRRGAFEIERFLRFVGQHWDEQDPIPLAEAIHHWCGRLPDRKAVTLANEFGVIRQLCLYRRRYDLSCYVPEHSWAPVKESRFSPYIFSPDEICQILAGASAHEGRFMWASMLRRLVLVLYCTGLRLGEAVRLQMADVDLERATLTISNSKRRTRIVPMRDDLVAELRCYIDDRHGLLIDQRRTDPQALFIRRNGSPLTTQSASEAPSRDAASPGHQAGTRTARRPSL